MLSGSTGHRAAGICLVTDDVPALRRFLTEVIDLTVEGDDNFLQIGPPELGLTAMRGAMVPVGALGGVLVQVHCGNVDDAASAVLDRGGTLLLPPTETDWGTRSAFIAGPGVVVELLQAP